MKGPPLSRAEMLAQMIYDANKKDEPRLSIHDPDFTKSLGLLIQQSKTTSTHNYHEQIADALKEAAHEIKEREKWMAEQIDDLGIF